MAKKKGEEEPCGNWMDTYGDLVTLLLTFFVLLLSMSSVNEEKFALLVKAFTSASPDTVNIILDQTGETEMEYAINRGDEPATSDTIADATLEELQTMLPDDFDELYEYIKAYVEKSGMESSVEVTKEGDGCVFIRFQDNIFFMPDSAVLKTDSEPLLDFLGNCLKSVEEQVMTININGHTADPGIENYRISDWMLSSERASNVAIYFEEEKDIEPQKLLPIGYGKNFPIADNATPEGREQNRRVDMVIISEDNDLTDERILNSILKGSFDESQYPQDSTIHEVNSLEDVSGESQHTDEQIQQPIQEDTTSDIEPDASVEQQSDENQQQSEQQSENSQQESVNESEQTQNNNDNTQ